MLTPKDARKILDREILTYMADMSPDNGECRAFHLSCFVQEHITKDMATAICRDLRNRGLATFERGLFDEEGMTAGSGYAITKAGREYVKQIWSEAEE